jgi:hypothetical protein
MAQASTVADSRSDHADRAIDRLVEHLDAGRAERAQIAETLRTFYQGPITMETLRPVLALALQLNPDLV